MVGIQVPFKNTTAWWFKVTFSGWLSDPLKGLSDLQLGDEKVTLNHLVGKLWICVIYQINPPQPEWSGRPFRGPDGTLTLTTVPFCWGLFSQAAGDFGRLYTLHIRPPKSLSKPDRRTRHGDHHFWGSNKKEWRPTAPSFENWLRRSCRELRIPGIPEELSIEISWLFFWDPHYKYDPYGSLYNWVTMSSARYSTLNFPGFFFRKNVNRVNPRRKKIRPTSNQFLRVPKTTQDAIAGHHQNLVIQYFFWCPKKTFRMPPMASG